jgi:V/A-type H+-transporting ATPase subunit C
MTKIGTYGFLNAKVRAMRSFLLNSRMYHSLIEARDLREMSSLLSQTVYQDALRNFDEKDPIEIEQILLYEEIVRLKKIEKYSQSTPKQIMRWFLQRYDCEKLKILLRLWHKKSQKETELLRWKILYDFPVKEILFAPNLSDIALLLNDTPFQKPLTQAISVYNEKHTLFPVELSLDKFLFEDVRDMMKTMGREDRRIARQLLGIEVDLKNLDWLSRFKEYYEIPAADIGQMLLSSGYHLSMNTLREVIASGNYTKAFSAITKGFDIPSSEKSSGKAALEMIEKILYQILLEKAENAFAKFPFSIGAIFGYFYLIRIETRNIRTLIHAKFYHLPSQTVESLLVM